MSELRGLRGLFVVTGLLALGSTVFAAPTIAGGPPPKVESANPPQAEQGTLGLDVTISGRNFDASAAVRFFVTGTTNPGGVTVNSVAFVDSETLVANIDVADSAEVSDFDIEVLLNNGRKGKGTEKFAVLQKGGGGNEEVALCVTFRNAVGDLVRSDLLSTPTYCAGESRQIVVRIGATNGHFNLYTSKSPREATVEIPDCEFLIGEACVTDVSLNTLNEWEDIGMGREPMGTNLDLRTIEVGETRYVDFQIAFPSHSQSTPHLVVFGSSNRYECGDPLPVTRLDEDNWIIEATTEGACLAKVVSKNLRELTRRGFQAPFQITLTAQ